ncbi:hypothetical protein Tco_0613876 [Tanacetum coccineum]
MQEIWPEKQKNTCNGDKVGKKKKAPSSQDVRARLKGIDQSFQMFVKGFNANFANIANAMTDDNQRQKDASEKLKDVLAKLVKLNIPTVDVLDAAEYSHQIKQKMDVFLNLPQELRITYIMKPNWFGISRDTIQLETAVSTISPEYLLEFTSEYGISEDLHPELPGPEERIVDFSEGKVGVYTKFFEFANFCLPISQFLFDILGHYQIHLSQLSVIGAAKVDERVFPTVVDWRINAPKDEMPVKGSYSAEDVAVLNTRHMDLFNLISAPNPQGAGLRPRADHEVPLLTATANHVIAMEDAPVALGS